METVSFNLPTECTVFKVTCELHKNNWRGKLASQPSYCGWRREPKVRDCAHTDQRFGPRGADTRRAGMDYGPHQWPLCPMGGRGYDGMAGDQEKSKSEVRGRRVEKRQERTGVVLSWKDRNGGGWKESTFPLAREDKKMCSCFGEDRAEVSLGLHLLEKWEWNHLPIGNSRSSKWCKVSWMEKCRGQSSQGRLRVWQSSCDLSSNSSLEKILFLTPGQKKGHLYVLLWDLSPPSFET